MKVLHVVGARPNFPKVAPVMAEMARFPDQITQLLVHTGQHYDYNMSQLFFEQLEMREPDEFLSVGSGSHAVQTAEVMKAFERVVEKHRPDWVFVVGDVNSTLAAALVCSKLAIHVAHVEAGLRSGDRTMPEEINRILTDQISDLLFTPSPDGDANLAREGIPPGKIYCVGNVMIDTVLRMLPAAQARQAAKAHQLEPGKFALVTLHRPGNVDHELTLREIMQTFETLSRDLPVLFPVHPRTRARIASLGLQPRSPRLILVQPLGYIEFLSLMQDAAVVLTDSGGVQEETTILGTPCLTVRPNTERPITITQGTNRLVSPDGPTLLTTIHSVLHVPPPKRHPDLWDGKAAQRIAAIMLEHSK
jgi:UDP-N-acetylglucosamine 2-epimerase (non-hydrolysing)